MRKLFLSLVMITLPLLAKAAVEPADWYLYAYSAEKGVNGNLCQFVTTDKSGVFLAENCQIPAKGIGFCVNNKAWTEIYGWSADKPATVNGINPVALGVTTNASGWLNLPAMAYDVTWNANDHTITFTPHVADGVKRVSVLGDSFGTFDTWMTPAENKSHYSVWSKYASNYQNLNSVEQTWWFKAIYESEGYALEVNNSYAGATMVNTPLSGYDVSCSFINRASNLGNPNVIFICGGTNDQWSTAPIGEYKYSDWTEDDKKQFRPGTAYLIHYLKTQYPAAQLYFVLNCGLDRVSESIRTICDHYGVPLIAPASIGKCFDYHPNVSGMATIAEGLKDAMAKTDGKTIPAKVYVADYLGDRTCAVSLTFDDGVEEHYSVVGPQLNKYGLKGTFGINGYYIGDRNDDFAPRMTWDEVRSLANDGHEINNHGWKHVNLWSATLAEAKEDIEKNDEAILREVGYRPKTYIFPWNGYNEENLKEVMKNRVCCRLWQFALGQVESGATTESIDAWLEQQISNRWWGITMTHGISVKSWDLWNDPEVLWAFFKQLAEKSDIVWTATLADVGAYVEERDNVQLDVQQDGDKLIVIPSLSLDKELFNMPLTLSVDGAEGTTATTATQDGMALTVIQKNGHAIMDFNPYGGPVEITLGFNESSGIQDLRFDGESTPQKSVNDRSIDENTFDLLGRRIANVQPNGHLKNGLYIVNGRKAVF